MLSATRGATVATLYAGVQCSWGQQLKIALVTNPDGDLGFRSSAEAYIADGAGSPDSLQHRLRGEYPKASVTVGIVDRGVERWYAYREGHWIQSTGERDW
jgi:hypothetical protein